MLDAYSIAESAEDPDTTRRAKSPFGYYGAKLRISNKIVSLLPPHNAWVEGFCGSAALTLAKPPAPIEIINDADDEIVNLFKQLRENSSELCRLVSLTPYSKKEFEIAKLRDSSLSELERARRFLVATMMTINGTNGTQSSGFSHSHSYTREGKEARVNRWYNLPSRLSYVVERLRGVRVENRDACDLLSNFVNRPATLVYLDPPYFVKRYHQYVVDESTLEFHTNLLRMCQRAKCMILLSGYENDLYREFLSEEKGWTKTHIDTQTGDTSGKRFSRTEVLWMNSQFCRAKENNKVPIRLKESEKKQRKVNPIRK